MRGVSSDNVNAAPMATVTAVIFIVAFAPVLCALAQQKENPRTEDCSSGEPGTQVIEVKTPKTTLKLKCSDKVKEHIKPAFEDTENFKVCTEKACTGEVLLSSYIDGATGKKLNQIEAEVQITTLPSTETTFYVRCGEEQPDPCYIEVKVAASKPVEDGNGQSVVPGDGPGSTGGVTPGRPLSCANGGGAITIKISEKGSTAQFTCGNFTLYPRAADKVFGEDCKKEESLKDIVRSGNDGVYTLIAGEKPPKKKWCYLCASSDVTSSLPGKPSDYCVVHVESSSRTQSSSAIALAVMLPCVLVMLRIT